MSRLICLAVKVSLYGVITQIVGYIFNAAEINYIEFVKAFMGIFAYQYWFITVYIIICLISPCLNAIVENLSRLYLGVLICIFLYFTYIWKFVDISNDMLARLSCGVTIYLIIGYIEKYHIISKTSHRFCLCVGGILMLFMIAFECLLSVVGNNYSANFFNVIVRMQNTHSPILLIIAILVFYGFLKLDIKQSDFINFFGKYSSGGYLIHGGAFFVPVWLYDGLFKAGIHYEEVWYKYLLSYAVFLLAVFFAGVVSDYIYDQLINPFVMTICKKSKIGNMKFIYGETVEK